MVDNRKIKNKITGRFVLRRGIIGQRIVKEYKAKRGAKKQERKEREEKKQSPPKRETKEREVKERDNDFINRLLYEQQVKEEQKKIMDDEANDLLKSIQESIIFKKQIKENKQKLKDGDIEAGFNLIILNAFGGDDIKYVQRIINRLTDNKKILIKINYINGHYTYISVDKNNYKTLFNIFLNNGYDVDNQDPQGSDGFAEIGQNIAEVSSIRPVERNNNVSMFRSKGGLFFKYINTSNIDLSRYQIINETQDINIINENCLIHSLRLLNIDEKFLSTIKSKIKYGAYIAKKHLKTISEIINKNIFLYQYTQQKDGTFKRCIDKIIIDNEHETIKLKLYDNHYMIYDEETDYTSYAIDNYNELNKIDNYKKITKIKLRNNNKISYERDARMKCTDSLYLIHKLKQHGLFIESNKINQHVKSVDNNNKKIIIDNIANEQREYIYDNEKETKNHTTKDIFFADTETDTSEEHTPLMIGVIKMCHLSNENEEKKINTIDDVKIFNRLDDPQKMMYSFLNYIIKSSKTKNIIVYFHNLKYDFHVLIEYLKIIDTCEKDNNIYSNKVVFKGRIFEFRDSYKMASMKLSDFQKSFALPKKLKKKEAIAYNYYKISNQQNFNVNIRDYIKHLQPDKIYTFMQNIRKNPLFDFNEDTKTFNPQSYYEYYLKYDCLILCEGMKTFNKSIIKLTDNKMNVFNYLTISSLSNKYFALNGCFDGVYEMTGSLRDYASRAITGGRVQALKETKKQNIYEKISDMDGVSLYPSAIYRLCTEMGLPLGMCKKILDVNDIDTIKNYSYSIMNIRITKINKKQQLPFIAIKKDDGILDYINELPDYGFVDVCIDNITLQDYINFHHIEYVILDGIYWNNGYNKKMGEYILHLFNDRLKYKGENNDAMQLIIKLMMNSAYGKTIIKKSCNKKIIKMTGGDKPEKDKTEKEKENKRQYEQYIDNHFNFIEKIERLNNFQDSITLSSLDESYNMSHVGVAILSMSKRIMNEVFDIANDNNLPIYYTDTDSMHLKYNDIPKLEKEYMNKYNRVLNGKKLGQFHPDFCLKDKNGVEIKGDTFATESIFLGKKCYIDRLFCTNKEGKIIGSGYHMRLKGMTEAGINDSLKRFNNNPMKMYEHLATKPLKMFLNPTGSFRIEYKQKRIRTLPENKFFRKIDFT